MRIAKNRKHSQKIAEIRKNSQKPGMRIAKNRKHSQKIAKIRKNSHCEFFAFFSRFFLVCEFRSRILPLITPKLVFKKKKKNREIWRGKKNRHFSPGLSVNVFRADSISPPPLGIGAGRVVFGRVVRTPRFYQTTRPKLGQLGHNSPYTRHNSPYTRHNSATTRPQLAHFYRQKHTGMGGDVVRLHTCNVGTTHDLKKNNQG